MKFIVVASVSQLLSTEIEAENEQEAQQIGNGLKREDFGVEATLFTVDSVEAKSYEEDQC